MLPSLKRNFLEARVFSFNPSNFVALFQDITTGAMSRHYLALSHHRLSSDMPPLALSHTAKPPKSFNVP
ncbi:hypothetical protein VNO78_12376 [Psophocarpus tetragonolobus]|uniref:Uncharacterized protein n=1 Tax=Psophocarpus tetragonolobus TaxID=3891 RepID=A0AAN9XPD6_PSOTE